MTKRVISFILILLHMALVIAPEALAMSSASYRIDKSAFSAGSGEPAGTGKIYDSNTALMLHVNSIGSAAYFFDSAAAHKTITANGNAQIDTAQSKFGAASGLFGGTGDY